MFELILAQELRLAIYCHGVFTELQDQKYPRVWDVLNFFKEANVDVIGHQEPHLRVSTNGADHASLVSNFLREGRGLVANETVMGLGGGRGGTRRLPLTVRCVPDCPTPE